MEVTTEELKELLQSQEGEFIIYVEIGGEKTHERTGSIPS